MTARLSKLQADSLGYDPIPLGACLMSDLAGQPLEALDTPRLLIDLDVLDRNLAFLQDACRRHGKDLRVHFKSLKCGSLARYLADRGVDRFLCAKLNEAEVLVDAGIADVLVANQVVGPVKLARLARLAKRARLSACVDDADNVTQMGEAARAGGAELGVLVEVDTGMARCGVEPGEPALALARAVVAQPGLRFAGLQGYDGHLQLLADRDEKRARCHAGLDSLLATRRLLEQHGIAVELVTGAGTGTWEFAAEHPALTELQPGSFLLMDAAYHAVRPEFGCALSVLATVVSRRPAWYVLDAGSKAISQDFGKPLVRDRSEEKVMKLSEEHTKVEDGGRGPKVGQRREVYPAHCCATMNLHREVVAVRRGRVEAVWPVEASGRYD
jgi:D-serine deaminase-like pyridoxal phosphate-dependent protein